MRLFGTDGIRDTAGKGSLSPSSVIRVGRALARFAREGRTAGPLRVGVGRDPRPSGPVIVADLARGLVAEGAEVEDLGVVPTPVVAWTVARRDLALGVAVSASHNPEGDNGIKPFARGGGKFSEEDEAKVERHHAEVDARVDGAGASTPAPAAEAYARETSAWLAAEGDLAGLRLVVDVAAGATGATAPDVLRSLGAQVEVLHPTGSRPINDRCGTEHPERWLAAVREARGEGGLAFDGDGDRVLVADAGGEILDGDAMLALLAEDLKARGRLPGDVVVTTVMSNLGLEERLDALGVRVERVPVGDRHVARRMRETGAAVGAEPSGHVVLPRESALIGDALVAGVRVLQASRRLGRSLAALRRAMPRYPQILRNVRVGEKRPFTQVPDLERAIRDAEAALGGRGRVVVRYSGTEPLLRIMAEGREREAVERAVRAVEAAAARWLVTPSS